MLPPGALTPAQTRVLLAVVAEHHDHGRATVSSVVARADGATRQPTWATLQRLRRAGYITWDDNTRGTLRPLLYVTAHTPTPKGHRTQ